MQVQDTRDSRDSRDLFLPPVVPSHSHNHAMQSQGFQIYQGLSWSSLASSSTSSHHSHQQQASQQVAMSQQNIFQQTINFQQIANLRQLREAVIQLQQQQQREQQLHLVHRRRMIENETRFSNHLTGYVVAIENLRNDHNNFRNNATS